MFEMLITIKTNMNVLGKNTVNYHPANHLINLSQKIQLAHIEDLLTYEIST